VVTNDALLERARAAAASVTDPELPPLTIDELGILRDVRMDGGTVEVAITPTYSGCPAMMEIKSAIETAVRESGAEKVRSDTGMDQRLADRQREAEAVGSRDRAA
jgi:ring-1,2-phenylacetyl-CoA epoxidase subunit PaaD